jgi:hypothetical protein
MDKTALATGESATLTIAVSGTGNIQDAGQPLFTAPADCKIYPDEPVTTSQVSASGTRGQKTFAFALVPTKAGNLILPPVILNWFDPQTGTFETAATKPFELTITQGTAQPAPAPSPTGTQNTIATPGTTPKNMKKDVTLLHRDILPLYDDVDAVTNKAPLSGTTFLALLFLQPLLFGSGLLARTRLRRSDHPSKKYASRAAALIKEARNAHDDEIYPLCSKALITAIASRTHNLSESLTYEEAHAQVLQTTGNQDLAARIRQQMLTLDTARYGATSTDTDHATLIEQTSTMVKELCA